VSADVSFERNRASAAEIRAHLSACDTGFVPRLSSRVELEVYAGKLAAHAERFEAWVSGRLVGLVAVYCNDTASGRAFVTSVSVLPDHQGGGIASALLRQSLEHARRHGLRSVELEVDARSLAAGRLYRRHGFATLHTDGTSETLHLTL
jgi:ribosomal protein S18 acetylase RimI-like enzyme